jgi:CubicO group peptidase (beta-lactamase class C family)
MSDPAVSVAIIDEGRFTAAGAWGVTVAGGTEPVTIDTIFQAGSVSKPVAAG